tara:strand:+ start:337 stop:501 length:165 start_codon:yes stop_codon:yes gene_type:complete
MFEILKKKNKKIIEENQNYKQALEFLKNNLMNIVDFLGNEENQSLLYQLNVNKD